MKSGVTFTGNWKEAKVRLKMINTLARTNVHNAAKRSAHELEKRIKRTINRGDPSWPALSPITVMRKGSDKPLRDSGLLESAISVSVINRTDFFVGVRSGRRTKSGVNLIKIAMAMEFGKVTVPVRAQTLAIPVTQEAQDLELAYGGIRNIPGIFHPKGTRILATKSGKSLNILFVLADYTVSPPRSYILSTFKNYKRYILARYRTAARYATQGKYYA